MADLGFKDRGDMMRYIMSRISLDSATIGLNTVRDSNLSPSYTKVYGGVHNIPNAALTTYNQIGTVTPVYNSLGAFNAASNTTLVIPKNGLYLFTVNWAWGLNAAGERQNYVYYNNAPYNPWGLTSWPSAVTGISNGTIAVVDILQKGDVLSFVGYQNTGGALALNADIGLIYMSPIKST